jgi:hypothetical protein
MAKFKIHIQLEQGTGADFQLIWKELEKESFRRREAGLNGDAAEYLLDRNISMQDLTHIVVRTVTQTGKKFSFTIIKEKGGFGQQQRERELSRA